MLCLAINVSVSGTGFQGSFGKLSYWVLYIIHWNVDVVVVLVFLGLWFGGRGYLRSKGCVCGWSTGSFFY